MIQNNDSKAAGISTGLHDEDLPIWAYPNQEWDKNEVTVRLVELILNMPDTERLDLLKGLQDRIFSEKTETSDQTHMPYEDMREHPRKTSLIAVDCKTHDVRFTNFINDISNGGVFIETNAHFYEGQQLKMNFSLAEADTPITVNGKVVRVNSQGIGVQFIDGDVDRVNVKV
jgi:Tfp pilus assembly protein PilZ